MKKNKGGFTLIETLVAVMILATSIAGPLSIAAKSLNVSVTAKNQISAFFLAQDAIEYVRYARDTNTLLGANWLSGAGGSAAGIDLTPCQNANGCYIDSTANTPPIPTVCSGTCPVINYDSGNSRFTYAAVGGTITKSLFTRKILLTQITTDEQKLTITLQWFDNASTTVVRSIIVNENIYAWQ